MNDKDLKKIWKDAAFNDRLQLNHQKILTDIHTANQKLDRQIKWRNVREIVAAIVVIIFFAIFFFITISSIVKFGIVLLILAALFIICKLLQVRNKKQPNGIALSIKDQLIHRKNYLKQEQALLTNILYWYLLPLTIPAIIIEIGFDTYRPGYWLSAVCLLGFIFWLNQKGAKQFDIYIGQLDKAIHQLNID